MICLWAQVKAPVDGMRWPDRSHVGKEGKEPSMAPRCWPGRCGKTSGRAGALLRKQHAKIVTPKAHLMERLRGSKIVLSHSRGKSKRGDLSVSLAGALVAIWRRGHLRSACGEGRVRESPSLRGATGKPRKEPSRRCSEQEDAGIKSHEDPQGLILLSSLLI